MTRHKAQRQIARHRRFAPALLLTGLGWVLGTTVPNAPVQASQTSNESIATYRGDVGVMMARVREELIRLPSYDVFDWIEASVSSDGSVALTGAVVEPTTKQHAEARAGKIEGVVDVSNEIEVLPLSPSDDRIRIAVYDTIYGVDSPLYRYRGRALAPVHIIVDRGHVILRGTVSSEVDRRYIGAEARSIPGVFDIENEIQLDAGA